MSECCINHSYHRDVGSSSNTPSGNSGSVVQSSSTPSAHHSPLFCCVHAENETASLPPQYGQSLTSGGTSSVAPERITTRSVGVSDLAFFIFTPFCPHRLTASVICYPTSRERLSIVPYWIANSRFQPLTPTAAISCVIAITPCPHSILADRLKRNSCLILSKQITKP